jgi:hypothetical protein
MSLSGWQKKLSKTFGQIPQYFPRCSHWKMNRKNGYVNRYKASVVSRATVTEVSCVSADAFALNPVDGHLASRGVEATHSMRAIAMGLYACDTGSGVSFGFHRIPLA